MHDGLFERSITFAVQVRCCMYKVDFIKHFTFEFDNLALFMVYPLPASPLQNARLVS